MRISSDEEVVITKVVQFLEANKFAFGVISIRGRLHLQKGAERFRQVLNRTVRQKYGKFGSTRPNSTQARFLDVVPGLYLAREVQPPLMYVGVTAD